MLVNRFSTVAASQFFPLILGRTEADFRFVSVPSHLATLPSSSLPLFHYSENAFRFPKNWSLTPINHHIPATSHTRPHQTPSSHPLFNFCLHRYPIIQMLCAAVLYSVVLVPSDTRVPSHILDCACIWYDTDTYFLYFYRFSKWSITSSLLFHGVWFQNVDFFVL